MMFEAQKKSPLVPYLLWFFLGGLGAHRLISGRIFSGIIMALLGVIGITTAFLFIGIPILIVVGIWWLVSARHWFKGPIRTVDVPAADTGPPEVAPA